MSQKMSWKPVKLNSQSSLRPSPRWGHSSCVIGDEIIIFGGYADSVYMNDMWSLNTKTMEWKQIITYGQVPAQRSNSTLNYDVKNNRLILFAGGGPNKTRYNEINILNWETKWWSNIYFAEDETAPWQRTYHSAQLMYPYLIIFGGEGMADLDDLWIFNLQTSKWKQITFPKNVARPCGRRFHSSCLIENQFYVIAGCHSKYRPLSDIFSIDLTKLKQTGTIQGLEWKQRIVNQQGFLMRWGQSIAVKQKNIYLFGGRFSNDLNDMLIFDTEKNKVKVVKVSNETIPKPRRRSCLSFIGSCLIMFGGFNAEYYNDLHYINMSENQSKPKKYYSKLDIKSLLNNKQNSDLQISAKNGRIFYCHKGILMQHFKNELRLQRFLKLADRCQREEDLQELLNCLYSGFGKCKILNKYLIDLPQYNYQKESQFNKYIDSFRIEKSYRQSVLENEKNKSYNSSIIVFQDEDFSRFLEKNRENSYKDITIKIGKFDYIRSNKILLMENSSFFKNILSSKFHENMKDETISIDLVVGNAILFEILINCLENTHLIVSEHFSYKQWIEMYKLADYLSLKEIQSIILYQIYTKIDQNSVNQIFQFASEFNLQDLALSACRFTLSKNSKIENYDNNAYMRICYDQNKFEIRQNMICNKQQPKIYKKNESNCQQVEEDKENMENCH